MAQPQVAVPAVDGVPAVNLAPGFDAGLELLAADGPGLPNQLTAAPWGVYLNGAPVITAESVVSFEFKKEWLLLDYPVEQGAFETYNKVWTPFVGRLRLVAGQDYAARQALLASVEAIVGDANIYNLVMPEGVFPSCNFFHFSFDRTARSGVGLLAIDVWVEEIADLGGGPAGVSNTFDPSSAAQVNGGTVQPVAAGSQQVQDLNAADVASADGIP